MEDVVPQLVEIIIGEFRRAYESSSKIQNLLAKVKNGTATYAQAQEYSLEVSRLIGAAYQKHISSAALPDGRMYYNIASRLVPSTMDENYQLVSNYAVEVQKKLNERAKVGLKAQPAEKDQDRIDGLVELASNAEQYDDVSDKLLSAFENYSQSIVDDTIQKNADFHYSSGLSPKIIRKTTGNCCPWCRSLAGFHNYPLDDREVYQRHSNCRCTVLYDPADGSKSFQNVHSKEWKSAEKYGTINQRKQRGTLSDSKRRYDPDIFIPQSVGAKQKDILVKLPDGRKVMLTPGSRITKVQTIAGLGRNRQIDIVDILTTKYPGSDALKWQKKKGIGYVDFDGESYKAELHWYEEPTVGKVEFKIKPDADGNWFYEDE